MMGTFNDFADSPTIFFPPHYHSYHSYNPIPRARPLQPQSAPMASMTQQQTASKPPPIITASRKRSRDEVEDEIDESTYASSNATPHTSGMMEEPLIYGEGMTLVNPITGRSTSAESQTGTWYEEYLEEERNASIKAAESLARDAAAAQPRPAKCQRIDLPSEPPVQGNVELLATSNNASQMYASPAVDATSVMLGVGWTAIGTEDHTQCAVRGWTKYIENHYPSLTNVEILLKSEGREAFLVKAMGPMEGLYLFSEDLVEARLLAHDWESCIAILRSSPAVFDGLQTLRAVRTPLVTTTEGMDYLQDPHSGTWVLGGSANVPNSAPLEQTEGMDLD